MMVTIRGLPLKTKYQDVKVILKNECNISEFILDNLVNDESGMGRKVRVGLVEDNDGYEIIKCLNGLRMPGNCVLRVDIVGKPPPSGQQGPSHYEPKSATNYSNEYRNNYSNQQTNDYRGRTNAPGFDASYTATQSQFSGPIPSHGPSGGQGPHAPVDTVGRPSPWGPSGASNNQWNQNQAMDSQNNYQQSGNPVYTQQYSSNTQRANTGPYPQGRAEQTQGYGFSAKTNPREMGGTRKPDTRTHVLRNVELVDTQPTNPPIQTGRYPLSQGFQQQKPITIMKDNFQGPTMYDIGSSNPSSSYHRHGQGSPQSWTPQGQQLKPQSYPKSNSGPYEKPYEDIRQHGIDKRPDSQKNTQQPIRTDVYKDYEKSGQRFSPHRAIASGGRQFSPSRRLMSPSRQVRPARAVSPSNPLPSGRRTSPSGRHSPTRRLISPADRMMSTMDRRPGGPPRELTQRHQVSPHERSERGNVPRYSPQRHRPDKPIEKNMDSEALKSSKHRPGYDAPTQAPNQPIYSGGFRPNVHENDPWQQDGDQMYAKMKKRDEDGLSTSHQNMYGDKRSPRKSRSPIRRERSPLRDRYRRHSPSSSSPRRSWAFEKRRSPEVREAPPPPNWPERDIRDDMRFKSVSDRKEDNSKHSPVWDKHPSAKLDGKRRNEKVEPHVDPTKVFRGDFANKIDTSRDELFAKHQRDPKFGARNEFENRRGFRPNDNNDPKPYLNKRDPEYHYPAERENSRRVDESRRKESPRRVEGKNTDFKTLDKDIESNYKRAQEFKNKAEELRKSERSMQLHSEERGRTTRIMEDKEFGASTRRIDDTFRHHMNDSPRRRMDDSPRRRMDGSPRRRMDGSPRRRMDGSPRRVMDGSPRRRMDGSPRRRMDGSPRRNMEGSPRRRIEDSPHHRSNDSLRRRIDGSPRHSHSDTEHRRRDELDTKTSPSREPIWKAVDKTRKFFTGLPAHIKTKRDKAAEEISKKLMNNKPVIGKLNSEGKYRVLEELKKTVSHKLTELFDIQDVSFIELVIKFQARVGDEEKDKIFDDVIKSLPGKFRNRKTLGSDPSSVPHKRPRFSMDHNLKEESSDMPHEKAKHSTEDKTKEGRINHPLYPEKARHIRGPKVLDAERNLEKRSVLKKSDVAPKIIKEEGVQSSVKEIVQKEKKVETKPSAGETKPSAGETVSVPLKLDARTTKVVESELQDIMIKVWQQLPDKPTNEAERLVVDKLRNNAGDSLRNMLGLNVTKRLLNVFNLLYVKLEFSAVPKRDDVIKMMRKYKLRGLKRIQRRPIIFGAYVNAIEDYDIICSEKVVRCGPVKVSVIPVYKFDKRPKNVITNFDDKDISNEDISDINKTIKNPVNKPKAQEKKIESKDEVKIEKQESPKVKNAEEDKPKPEKRPLKQYSGNIKKLDKNSEPKPQRKNLKTVKRIINKKPTEETKKEVRKSEQPKLKDNSSIKNVFTEGNDFDELDDDTILALMSEGIVVDECSGSE